NSDGPSALPAGGLSVNLHRLRLVRKRAEVETRHANTCRSIRRYLLCHLGRGCILRLPIQRHSTTMLLAVADTTQTSSWMLACQRDGGPIFHRRAIVKTGCQRSALPSSSSHHTHSA